MNFDLDEPQRMLQATTREFLHAKCDKSVVRQLEASETGHSPELWKTMAELGWLGILIPERYGGLGLGLLEMAIVFEEIGRAAFDSPLFATVMGSLAIVEGGTEAQKRELLPKIAAGERIVTVAWAERDVSNDFRFVSVAARPADDGYVVQGTKLFVPYATVADDILVVARTAGKAGNKTGLTLFTVSGAAPGMRCSPLATIAPDKQYRIDFDEVRVSSDRIVGQREKAFPLLQVVAEQAMALQCAEMVGGAQHELEVTAAYTKERVQFDRPIGTFQAVQHRLADMFTDVQGARWTSYQVITRLGRGIPAVKELAIAKAFTSEACQRVAFSAQQLHGGAGVDMGNDLHFYYRRAKALELRFGASPIHLKALESHIGL